MERITAVVVAASALSAGAASAAGGPSVTITSPTSGQRVSAHKTAYLRRPRAPACSPSPSTSKALHQGNGVLVGSDSETVLVTPAQADYPVQFTIQPNGALDQADLSGLDLRVHVEGPYAFSGFIGNSGKSWVDVPSWSASSARSVQISVDDPSFANAVPARLWGTSWSAAVPTPALGSHVVYARATQGFDTGASTS